MFGTYARNYFVGQGRYPAESKAPTPSSPQPVEQKKFIGSGEDVFLDPCLNYLILQDEEEMVCS